MIRKFDEMIAKALTCSKKTFAVAVAQDIDVLQAVISAKEKGLADIILIGSEQKIVQISKENGLNIDGFEIINEAGDIECCNIAVKLVTSGRAHVIMKGFVDTAILLKSVLDKDASLRSGKLLSHISMFDIPGFNRILFVSDPAITLLPTLEQKKAIIENAVYVAHKFGIERPYVAPICAIEKLNPKMQATVDAAELHAMNARGEIAGCYVSGPISLDVAVSQEAAHHKNYTDEIGGKADVLIMPNIETGNALHKAIVFFGEGTSSGIVIGAKCPIIMTSRADSEISKFSAIASAVLISH